MSTVERTDGSRTLDRHSKTASLCPEVCPAALVEERGRL